MTAQTPHNRTPLSIAGFNLILLVSLLFTSTSWASSADWGLVQRFQTQLELAQNGNVKAMYEVGRIYERGRGTGKSFEEAAIWYQKAADSGSHTAKARLGKMYLEGRGVKKNINKAYKLLTDAAKNNVPSAQYQLAIMYEIGIGIGEDTSKALYWYKKAAKLGHYQAERKVKKLGRASSTPYIASPATPKPQAKSQTTAKKPAPASKPAAKSEPASNNLIEAIAKGSWQRRKRPTGYLPSSTSNCKKVGTKTLVCISTEQERKTGSEIISFNTEATITSTGGKNFIIEYSNNVLEVELVQNDVPSGVEGDEEATSSTATQNSIQKGKQEKVHHLDCKLSNAKTISCLKDSTRTLEFKTK